MALMILLVSKNEMAQMKQAWEMINALTLCGGEGTILCQFMMVRC